MLVNQNRMLSLAVSPDGVYYSGGVEAEYLHGCSH